MFSRIDQVRIISLRSRRAQNIGNGEVSGYQKLHNWRVALRCCWAYVVTIIFYIISSLAKRRHIVPPLLSHTIFRSSMANGSSNHDHD